MPGIGWSINLTYSGSSITRLTSTRWQWVVTTADANFFIVRFKISWASHAEKTRLANHSRSITGDIGESIGIGDRIQMTGIALASNCKITKAESFDTLIDTLNIGINGKSTEINRCITRTTGANTLVTNSRIGTT